MNKEFIQKVHKANITIKALYKGKLDRKIFLHFEKDEPYAKFKIMN